MFIHAVKNYIQASTSSADTDVSLFTEHKRFSKWLQYLNRMPFEQGITRSRFVRIHKSSPGTHFVEAFLSGLEETLVLQTQTLQQVDHTAVVH